MQGLLSGVVLGRLSDYWGRFPCYLTALMCEVCESGPFKQPFINIFKTDHFTETGSGQT
jgi:hypothetical protein